MKKGSIFFRSRQNSPALTYILNEILGRRLGLSFSIIPPDENLPEDSICIHYGIPGGNLFFPDSGILWQRFPKSVNFKPGFQNYALQTNERTTECDLFGTAFFLLSRFEEQTNVVKPDQHGRYPDAEHFREEQFRNLPLVECWTETLRQKLGELGISCLKAKAEPGFSIDWDNPTAYLNKGFLRSSAAFLKDLFNGNSSGLKARLNVTLGRRPDPYDNLGNRIPTEILRSRRIFFWLGDYGKFDKGLSYKNHWYRNQILQLSRNMSPGLHPSYAAFQNPEQLQKEKQRLEEILAAPITSSRFHFLRFRLPEAYRMLEECGIREDFSMGFSAFPGFRAGTALPFHWFDLEKNQAGNLLIHPFSLMDSSAEFRGAAKDVFLKEAQRQLITAEDFGFPVHAIFHNEHPSWQGWEETIASYLRLPLRNTASGRD